MKKFKGVIYQVINIQNGKSYIGKTMQEFEGYKKWHIENAMNKKDLDVNPKGKYFYNAIRKYGPENFKWVILGEIFTDIKEELKKELNEAEIESIWLFRTFGSNGENIDNTYGYNQTKGGDGGDTISGLSDKDKLKRGLKISKGNKGREKSQEERSAISKRMSNKYVSDETKKLQSDLATIRMENIELRNTISTTLTQSLSDPLIRQKMSDTTKKLHKNPVYREHYLAGRPRGVSHSRYGKHGKDNILSKPVLMFTKDGINFLKEYESAADASRATNIHQGNISACARGAVKSAGGFLWKYK